MALMIIAPELEVEMFAEELQIWEDMLSDLEIDPIRTADRLDWTAKLRILQGYRDRDGLEWDDPKLRLLDLQYHDVDRRRGLYNRLAAAGRMQRLFSEEDYLSRDQYTTPTRPMKRSSLPLMSTDFSSPQPVSMAKMA